MNEREGEEEEKEWRKGWKAKILINKNKKEKIRKNGLEGGGEEERRLKE